MVRTVAPFSALLRALSLTQAFQKPTPGFVPSLADSPTTAHQSVKARDGYGYPQPSPGYVPYPSPNSSGTSYIQTDSSPCNVNFYSTPLVANQSFPPFDQAKATVYRYREQQSVNLGSWFVHENWMTPSVFACASGQQLSELDIASGWNSTTSARAVLEHHWDTFINQSDFEYLASIGINTVRIPIGYWTLGPDFCQGTPFENVSDVYQNSWPRLTRAINWAGQSGIGVLVDLHGAPGSQNGQPHSGISDGITGLFDSPAYTNLTITVLTFLMEQLMNVTNVIGIELLNEPQDVPQLPDFYMNAISSMRQVSPATASFPLYIHDAFNLAQFTTLVANLMGFTVVDHHSYFVFTPSDNTEPASQHTSDIQGSIADSLRSAASQARNNLVVDEWSCALTPQSLAGESNPDQARRDFCIAQLDTYTNATAGWGFWSYDKEDCSDDPGWCFKAAVGNSLPSTFFSYGQGPLTSPAQLPNLTDLMGDMNAPSAAIIASSQASSTPSYDAASPIQQGEDPDITPALMHRRSWLRNQRPAGSSWRNKPESLLALQTYKRRQIDGATGMSPAQRSIARGYSDGFLTAKIFALYGMSKLGFIGQYTNDSIAKLGPSVVKPGTEGQYQEWFLQGLRDGENIVTSHVGQSTN
ncbi:uncharacterized protein FIBRA_00440 [Fibroporia radiculosa]|uniref:Glycoside hydrolase family 5 domain-containing protein n=1 Tax=Fibroporia radiculosa TaxID=599839 RepID=J4G084_9APHY|nr:uncharacterized protein FIBRA_00440 [Fibroporia radiculosa]CCL98443.1 predicted protein [Fibroporia radiculosa]